MVQDILIYEYNNSFYVIQRSQQGMAAPDNKSHQYPSENAGLFARLDVPCSNEEMGKAIIEALDRFDTVRPKYEPWELKELNAQLCSWIGAKGINVLNKNSRLIQVQRDGNVLSIVPFDNCNKNPWYGPMTKEAGFGKDIIFTATSDSPYEIIGTLALDAFNVSTYNPLSGAKSSTTSASAKTLPTACSTGKLSGITGMGRSNQDEKDDGANLL